MSEKSTAKTELMRPAESAPAPPVVVQLGSAEAAASNFSFGLLWNALRQRLKFTIPLAIVLSAASCGALWYFTEDLYRSSSWLQIHSQQPFLIAQTATVNPRTFSQTQVELLRSRPIINRAIDSDGLRSLPEIRQLDPRQDPASWISSRLKVTPVNQSELYEVSFVSPNATSAQRVVAAIVTAYVRNDSQESVKKQGTLLERLQQVQQTRRREIETRREKLRDLARQSGGQRVITGGVAGQLAADVGLTGRLPVLSALHKEQVETDIELEFKKAELELVRERIEKVAGPSDQEMDAIVVAHPQIAKLEAECAQQRKKLTAFQPTSKAYQKEQSKYEDLEKALAQEKEKLRPQVRQELDADRRKSLTALEGEVADLERMAGLLHEKVETERKNHLQQGDKSLEFDFAQIELTNSQEIAQRVMDRIIHLQTESAAPAQFLIIEPATLPQFPEGPTLMKKLVMVGAVGFFAPFVLFIGWDLLYRRVFEREQLQREVKLRFVSEVAALPTRPLLRRLGSGASYKRQLVQFEESVNSLRTTLSVEKSVEGCQVFVLASAVSGEGKTNLSSQLAMSWSQAEPGKVLIVDGDLRSPNVHDLFEVQPGPGLAEVLRGECALEDAIVMDWGDRLYILPAGDLRADSASQLFAGPVFRELLAKLRTQYRKIVIDVPPVLCASEVLLITKQADAVLMCTLHDHSRAGQFKLAYDRLVAAGANVVGAVLNGAPIRQYSYDYRGYGAS